MSYFLDFCSTSSQWFFFAKFQSSTVPLSNLTLPRVVKARMMSNGVGEAKEVWGMVISDIGVGHCHIIFFHIFPLVWLSICSFQSCSCSCSCSCSFSSCSFSSSCSYAFCFRGDICRMKHVDGTAAQKWGHAKEIEMDHSLLDSKWHGNMFL